MSFRAFRTSLLVTLAAALLLAVFLPAAASAAEATQPGLFGETVDVRVVNVEAVVTDKQGNRITGLGPDDLRLIVDGDEIPIQYFTEVRSGVAVDPAASLRGAVAGRTAVPGLPAAAAGEPVGTSYLVFVDDYFPIERDRNRVLAALADDLGQLGANDRMAVVAFDGQRVEMLTSWSGSQRQLDGALRQAMDRPAHGLQYLAFQRGFESGFARSRYGAGRYGAGSFPRPFNDLSVDERAQARQIQARIERATSAAVATLRGFAQPPGRKVMLLLTGGWPYSTGAYVADDSLRPTAAIDYGDGARIYDPLTDTANLLGYTVYPVDVPGLAASFGADVERSGSLYAFGPETSPLGVSAERERLLHDTLYYLAEETGGRPLINAGRTKALAEVAADTRSYYWIGFSPARDRDDRLHRIEVEAVEPGLRVRSRAGFRDLSRATESSMAVESALLFGQGEASLGLVAELGEPRRSGRKMIQVPVTLAIPLDAVTSLPENGSHVVHLELRVAALDGRDRRSEIPTVPLELRFDELPAAGQAVSYETTLELRNEEQDVVVSLLDPFSGNTLMARLAVEPTSGR